MNKFDYDFYYVIICARGPGTETITVANLDSDTQGLRIPKGAKKELKKLGVFEADYEFGDEGYTLGVPAGTMPLKNIIKWMVKDNKEWHLEDEGDGQAFLSACFRLFLQTPINEDNNKWTSTNGWRKVSIEMPSKRQFKMLMDATKSKIKDMEKWNCAVIKEACRLYRLNQLPSKDYRGC